MIRLAVVKAKMAWKHPNMVSLLVLTSLACFVDLNHSLSSFGTSNRQDYDAAINILPMAL